MPEKMKSFSITSSLNYRQGHLSSRIVCMLNKVSYYILIVFSILRNLIIQNQSMISIQNN